ncbi:MAG: rhodanese-like domain-containing protein [Bdellovibrionia bacterium]
MKQKLNDSKSAFEYFAAKLAFTAGPSELKYYQEQNEKFNLIDVRKKEDYAKGHIPGAVNLPEEDWKSLKGLSKDSNNILYCYNESCHLAARAAYHFAESGYPVMELQGGFKAWKDYDYAIEGSGGGSGGSGGYSGSGGSGGSGNSQDYKKSV